MTLREKLDQVESAESELRRMQRVLEQLKGVLLRAVVEEIGPDPYLLSINTTRLRAWLRNMDQ